MGPGEAKPGKQLSVVVHESSDDTDLFVHLFFRCHIISQFNQGFYDYIIAADEQSLAVPAAGAASADVTAAQGKKKKTPEKGGK